MLEQAANKLNSSNEKYLLGRRNIYAQNIQEKLAEYNKLHANDAATIHDEVEKSIEGIENKIASAVFAVGAVKGIEFGVFRMIITKPLQRKIKKLIIKQMSIKLRLKEVMKRL